MVFLTFSLTYFVTLQTKFRNSMKKRITLTLLTAMIQAVCLAQFTTNGEGNTYSIHTLSSMSETGIISYELVDIPGYQPEYELTQSITIAAGDKFVMDNGIVLHFAKDVTLSIEGEADFNLPSGSTLSGLESNASVLIQSSTRTTFQNCHFQNVGLEMRSEGGVDISHCSFMAHDGSSAAALYFITAGAESSIVDCSFEDCAKAAIGSAANASQPMTIRGCELVKNSTANGNIPQINITVASPLVISGCHIVGNPENTKVGGLGISNFMGYDADVTISGCTIEDNRYGIGLVGPAAKILLENNTLLNNRYETNPMNGGSGISLYDPYKLTQARITGNYIEGSLWGVTVIGCKDVNMGHLDNTDDYNPGNNVFKDNGFDGELYDLYNNSTLTIYAQNNTWNVSEQTEEQIETVIFHQNDDPSLGQVIFMPAATTTSIADIQDATQHTPMYNLQGQRLNRVNGRQGIIIANGKKKVVR